MLFPSPENGTPLHNKKPGAVTRPGFCVTVTDMFFYMNLVTFVKHGMMPLRSGRRCLYSAIMRNSRFAIAELSEIVLMLFLIVSTPRPEPAHRACGRAAILLAVDRKARSERGMPAHLSAGRARRDCRP